MTKNELLADLAPRFTAIVMTEAGPQNSENLAVKRYRSVVLETNVVDDIPIAIQRAVEFYVLNEGLENETAYYMNEEPKPVLTGEASPGQG
jgi:hypothetical protein